MKYFVANFKIECEAELMQPARELLSAAACEAGFEAFEDTDDGLLGYVQRPMYDKEALDAAIADYMPEGAAVSYAVEEVPDQNWNQGWEDEGFEPIGVSDNLVIYDAKHTDREMFAGDDGVMRIFIEARNAFGTGTHQTTRMILRRLLAMDVQGKSVLDCGCGTGILGITASRLGANPVLGYDIDEWSADNAQHNAALNGVENMSVMLGDASVLNNVAERFDVVIANINRNILIADMPAFRAHMKQGAQLILSGFYEADVPMIEAAAKEHGLSLCDVVTDEEWACALFK
ncbi:50S ribosomal protein L11 methyltransferase [Leyella stercorea]|mgnify:FL=1|uniref:50S ribosomal protein L11 methyltransferase n=1 Tax=Leyella stercorea TaxID=363265 RepID=UPI0026DB2EF0|nr:50S ribosomal protein L11 methyltransferase [Leyella stercorea]